MKVFLLLGIMILTGNLVHAQVTPDVDMKPSSALTLALAPPKVFETLPLDLKSPDSLKRLNLNFRPALEMLSMLEGRGAKVGARIVEGKGVRVLEASVDGKSIPPILLECNACEIVFEY